VTNNTILSLLN